MAGLIFGGIALAAFLGIIFIPVKDEDLPQTPEEMEEDDKNWRQL